MRPALATLVAATGAPLCLWKLWRSGSGGRTTPATPTARPTSPPIEGGDQDGSGSRTKVRRGDGSPPLRVTLAAALARRGATRARPPGVARLRSIRLRAGVVRGGRAEPLFLRACWRPCVHWVGLVCATRPPGTWGVRPCIFERTRRALGRLWRPAHDANGPRRVVLALTTRAGRFSSLHVWA